MRRSLLVNFIIFNQEIHEINNFRDFYVKQDFSILRIFQVYEHTKSVIFFSLKNSINFPDLATFSVIFSLIYSVNSDANFIIITIITLFIYFYTYLIYHPGVTLNLQKLNINASWFFDAIKFYYFFTAHFQLTKLLLYSAPRLFYEALNNCSRVSFFTIVHHTVDFDPIFVAKIMKETS